MAKVTITLEDGESDGEVKNEMLRRQQAKEPLMAEGDTHACECGNGLVCRDGCWQRAGGSEVKGV